MNNMIQNKIISVLAFSCIALMMLAPTTSVNAGYYVNVTKTMADAAAYDYDTNSNWAGSASAYINDINDFGFELDANYYYGLAEATIYIDSGAVSNLWVMPKSTYYWISVCWKFRGHYADNADGELKFKYTLYRSGPTNIFTYTKTYTTDQDWDDDYIIHNIGGASLSTAYGYNLKVEVYCKNDFPWGNPSDETDFVGADYMSLEYVNFKYYESGGGGPF